MCQLDQRVTDISSSERLLAECRQQNIVLEGELEQAHDDTQRLRDSLDTYKQKYQDSTEQLGRIEESFSIAQKQLAESRNGEREKEADIATLRGNLTILEERLDEKTTSQARAEDIIEQLTTELNNTQDDLSKALDKLGECDNAITRLKAQNAQLQNEVNGGREGAGQKLRRR